VRLLDAALLIAFEPQPTDVFVCLAAALTDDLKLRLDRECTIKTILHLFLVTIML
jgi:hypothetical protein